MSSWKAEGEPLDVDESQPIGGENPSDADEIEAAKNWASMDADKKAYLLAADMRAQRIVSEIQN